ncbi:DUF4157 domain-containing protein [Clostridium sp. BNL1100]|uniref:eCIS core domain-containing protein n=1 Tax=Clostridium sp. BNL1100 TaxID=755731 RepID=UPI00024A792B|nr:DUF4157 domain-containing protein [Clostridium sp. BNL1100]AEY66096.1 hypothetical protein Clo1100_1892 [Clostridium sp. BNL1100]
MQTKMLVKKPEPGWTNNLMYNNQKNKPAANKKNVRTTDYKKLLQIMLNDPDAITREEFLFLQSITGYRQTVTLREDAKIRKKQRKLEQTNVAMKPISLEKTKSEIEKNSDSKIGASELKNNDEKNPLQMKKDNSETPGSSSGIQHNLRAGLERLSGIDLSDLSVHTNSDKPKQVGALAYTQGNTIHIAPGQEKHLPHEGWHAVQQKQGRVVPTLQIKTGTLVNDDANLEKEADIMGSKAVQVGSQDSMGQLKESFPVSVVKNNGYVIQRRKKENIFTDYIKKAKAIAAEKEKTTPTKKENIFTAYTKKAKAIAAEKEKTTPTKKENIFTAYTKKAKATAAEKEKTTPTKKENIFTAYTKKAKAIATEKEKTIPTKNKKGTLLESIKAYVEEANNKNGDMEKDNSKDGNTFYAEVITSPGNLVGTVASLLETTMEAAKIYVPKEILKTPRRNNIGIGKWIKDINAKAASTASGFGKVAKVANDIGKAAAITSLIVDTSFGIYENIQEDAPIDKIIIDAEVDSLYSAGGIAASAAAGSVAGSVVPGAGTLAGAAGGAIGGIAYMIVTEGVNIDGKSLKDLTKDALYKEKHGRAKLGNPNISLKPNSESMKMLRKKIEDKKSKDSKKN